MVRPIKINDGAAVGSGWAQVARAFKWIETNEHQILIWFSALIIIIKNVNWYAVQSEPNKVLFSIELDRNWWWIWAVYKNQWFEFVINDAMNSNEMEWIGIKKWRRMKYDEPIYSSTMKESNNWYTPTRKHAS